MTRPPATSAEASGTVRIGVVDDHDLIVDGLRRTLCAEAGFDIVVAGATVDAVLAPGIRFDLAILDLSLPDDSAVGENIAALRSAGVAKILVLTAGDRPDLVRAAARAGVLGVLRKSESATTIRSAVRDAAAGVTIGTVDWAAAIDADPRRPELSPREEETLALYAAGESADDVAELMGISVNTVHLYVSRIRAKYATAGTPVVSRAQLRRAAQRDGFVPLPWWRRRRP